MKAPSQGRHTIRPIIRLTIGNNTTRPGSSIINNTISVIMPKSCLLNAHKIATMPMNPNPNHLNFYRKP